MRVRWTYETTPYDTNYYLELIPRGIALDTVAISVECAASLDGEGCVDDGPDLTSVSLTWHTDGGRHGGLRVLRPADELSAQDEARIDSYLHSMDGLNDAGAAWAGMRHAPDDSTPLDA